MSRNTLPFRLLGIAAALLLHATVAAAGALRCSIGEVVVENLKIGQSYSLKTLANLTPTSTNPGAEYSSTLTVTAQ